MEGLKEVTETLPESLQVWWLCTVQKRIGLWLVGSPNGIHRELLMQRVVVNAKTETQIFKVMRINDLRDQPKIGHLFQFP